jgi:hypothetical protein
MTTTVHVTLADFAQRLRRLGPEMQRSIVRGLRAGAKRVRAGVAQSIAETQPHPPVDTGVYRAAFEVDSLSNGARVENRVLHAELMEVGRRPGPVPLQPIAEWVKRKRLYEDELQRVLASRRSEHRSERATLRASVRGTDSERSSMRALRRRQRNDAIDEAVKRVAFVIRRKIAREGFAPRFPMRRALEDNRRDIELAILAAIDELEP